MVTLGRGSVALVPFPFSDLSQAKLRPAIVLASVGRGDWILCQVTSNAYGDDRAIPIATDDLPTVGCEWPALPGPENSSPRTRLLFGCRRGG